VRTSIAMRIPRSIFLGAAMLSVCVFRAMNYIYVICDREIEKRLLQPELRGEMVHSSQATTTGQNLRPRSLGMKLEKECLDRMFAVSAWNDVKKRKV
jgi:hypothetical protein